MALVRIDRDPSGRQLAVFGGLWLVFFSVLAGVAASRGAPSGAAIALAVGAVLVPAAGLVWPIVLKAAYLAMAVATYPIGLVVSYAVLLVVYYAVVTPVSLMMRLAGYDPMCRRFEPGTASYWVPRKETGDDPRRYFRQY